MGSYMEIALQIKKFSILSMRTFHKSVRQHPLLVGMILFLVFLYRSFPFLFSLLLSASPVLVCTAVLLGTLLSFGQPNIPEIEKEEKLSHDVVSLKTSGVSGDCTLVVERDESFAIEKYSGDRGDLVDNSIEDVGFVGDKFHSKVESHLDSPDCVPLIDESSREIHTEKRVVEDMERGFLDFEFEKKKESSQEYSRIEEGVLRDGKAVEDHQYSLVPEIADDEILAVDVDGAHGESVETYKEDHLESSQPAGGDDDDNEEDGSSYSESDRAESSSPDASMADIIPMLDELHPLLDLEAPQAPHMSHDEFDVASEHSQGSDLDSADSDAESENHADELEEDGADDNDDDEDVQGGKDDESKAAIKWTEDDQKNLMDLGTSELERNQRLENLIARRRARKSFRLMAERNLIDLDSADLPFNVPPIATTRHNPFDHPHDSYENMGLPPIPGSAPSILLARRNPFDLPYDPNEEKPDLKGDNFEQEFLAFHQKDMLFRRHESFSLGPSVLGGSRQDTKWPVFVPERLASEGTSYPLFQRQLSEVSESKLSSVPDTESASSVPDADEKKLTDQDFSQESELPANAYQASDLVVEHGSEASDDVDSVEMERAEKRDIEHDEDVITLQEAENHNETELDLSETRDLAADVELNASTVDPKTESLKEEECSSKSSLPSLPEVDNRLPAVKNKDSSKNLEEGGHDIDELIIPAHSLLAESEFQLTSSIVDDNQNKEPVYDSSPSATERLFSLSSISSDVQVEMSEIAKPSTSGEIGESFESQAFLVEGESIHKDISGCEEMTVASSKVDAVKDIAVESGEVTESREIDGPEYDDQIISMAPASGPVRISIDSVTFSSEIQSAEKTENQEKSNAVLGSSNPDIELLPAIHHNEDAKLHTMDSTYLISFDDTSMSEEHREQASSVEHASVCSNLSTSRTAPLEKQAVVWEESITLDQHQIQSDFSSEKTSGEEDVLKAEVIQTEENEIKLSSSDSDTKVESSQDLGLWLEALESSYQHAPSSDLPVAVLEEAQRLLVVEHVSVVHPSSCTLENHHGKEVPITVEETVPFEQDQLHSSSSDAKVEASVLQDSELTLASEKKSSFELEKELYWSDKPMVEAEIANHDIHHESTIIMEKAEEESSISHDVCDPVDKVLANISSGTSDSASTPSNPLEYKPLAGEIDLQDSILDGILNVDDDELADHSNCELKAHVAEEDIKEEVDEIKEIDEELLSELDAVGDFRVKELVAESLHSKLIIEEANVGNSEPAVLPSSSKPSETSPELPVLEVRSLEDIDLAFKQLHEGADVEEVILPSMLEEWPGIEESSETITDMKFVKARSLEDGDVGRLQTPLNSKNESTKVGTTSDLEVVEARSLDDIQIALKQVLEGDVGGLSTPLNSKSESTKVGTSSDLEVVEARSVENNRIALKQVSEGDVDELPTPLNSKNESTEAGISEVGSIETESGKEESGLEEVSSIAAYELKEGSHESLGNSSTGTSDGKDKKLKVRPVRSGSSCTSISSSSSSSSDSE